MNKQEVENLLFDAASAHQSGQLAVAAERYAQVIASDPKNSVANHNLGILAMQTGKGLGQALPRFLLAWEADPTHLQHWISYLRALVQSGDVERARIVFADGAQRGLRGPTIETLLAQAAPAKQTTAAAQNVTSGVALPLDLRREQAELEQLFAARQFTQAEAQARTLITKHGAHPLGWRALAAALIEQQRDQEAIQALTRCVQLMPGDLTAPIQLGQLLERDGQFAQAEACFRKALSIDSRALTAQLGLAATLIKLYRFSDAEAASRAAITIAGNSVDAYLLLGDAQLGLNHVDEAIHSYQQALRLHPDNIAAYQKLGALFFTRRDEVQLLDLIQEMIQVAPNYVEAHRDLGLVHLRNGRLEEAMAAFQIAVRLKPQDLETRENLLFCANYLTSWSAQSLFEECQEYGKQARAQATPFKQWTASLSPSVLRVGLVSGDLVEHPVGYFLATVLEHSPRTRVEWFVYSTNAADDVMTAKLRTYVQNWRVVAGLSAETIAHAIHADGVHVLIDLAGHTARNALRVFAWRPAPVQVSWLGYFASTGLKEIDYLIADRTCVPESEQAFFTESIWYLPETRLCFSAPNSALEVAPLPALDNHYVTFGSFQTMRKINDAVLHAWAEILRRCAKARLRVQNGELATVIGRETFMRRLQAQGIDVSRVELCAQENRGRYLEQHAYLDILLDSFPFPGGTTTCEALWMGVPTVTLLGRAMIARQGASLLSAAGLPDWIADSPEHYIELAQQKAGDLDALAKLRAGLRARLASSALMDAPRFAHNLSEAFWAMWRKHQD